MQLATPIVRLLSVYTPVLGPGPRAHYDFIKMLSAKIRIFRTFVWSWEGSNGGILWGARVKSNCNMPNHVCDTVHSMLSVAICPASTPARILALATVTLLPPALQRRNWPGWRPTGAYL